jgi:hypothetical protein
MLSVNLCALDACTVTVRHLHGAEVHYKIQSSVALYIYTDGHVTIDKNKLKYSFFCDINPNQ